MVDMNLKDIEDVNSPASLTYLNEKPEVAGLPKLTPSSQTEVRELFRMAHLRGLELFLQMGRSI
jgi:hypothetical protein